MFFLVKSQSLIEVSKTTKIIVTTITVKIRQKKGQKAILFCSAYSSSCELLPHLTQAYMLSSVKISPPTTLDVFWKKCPAQTRLPHPPVEVKQHLAVLHLQITEP